MARFDGKTALVTGGGRGIGRGIVLTLAREGADVVIADIDLPRAEATAVEVRALGRRATLLRIDVTDQASVDRGLAEAIAAHGRIDILVNNAGIGPDHMGAAADAHDWDLCYEVNLKGVWRMSTAIAAHFRDNGGGRIVTVASIAGRLGGTGLAPYSASKAGVINLTQSLALSLGRHNVNVNAVCPGLIWTDMWRKTESLIQRDASPETIDRRAAFEAAVRSQCVLGREQTPQDIGWAVAFLASDEAGNITGQALNVDGGIRMN